MLTLITILAYREEDTGRQQAPSTGKVKAKAQSAAAANEREKTNRQQ